ncbi:ubiquinone biosynthesis protein COQ9, mitochondrial-like isoform X3 [Haliotis rufescens]|uniref:ubiquinone biosynthesis protein COQ9, mitochondrial-like isoform X3 n=1 Tax=Haliotis rufescens TaxID=6454 RepID=UPI00201E8F87|nr:ubiquinone biosynthesis protein COQ9, mitochondrial-like isoform X3 [Haliotis rufescens]
MACVPFFRKLDSYSRIARKSLWILSSRNVSHNQGQGETTNHQHNGDSIKTDQYEEEDHEMKQRILRAALAFVPQHGWSRKTLAAGAEMEGLPPVAHGMFPRGGAELVHYLYTRSNRQLADALAAEVEELYTQGAEKPQTRPFIAKAVQSRLRMLLPYIEHWPQAMAIQALPQNATESWSNLATLTDDIWYHVGDRSTDFNWYTKRASLAVVYKATEIFMIQDRSEDFTDTWVFLDRRLDNIAVFSKSVKSMEQLSSVMSEGFLGMFIVGRNILGLNSRHR